MPRLTAAEARARGARSLVIGIANEGGRILESWIPSLVSALEAGLDIVSGMHARLEDTPALKSAAERQGRRLINVRTPPRNIPIGTGAKRSGKRLLTVGTDCALGKKYTALALARAFRARSVAADFRATGQTGIMIAGSGMPMDAVVADFEAGAAEQLSPHAAADHWDVIEGQGSLFHPSYAAVSLGLLHGSQPDVIVVCHEPGRRQVVGLETLSSCRRSRRPSSSTSGSGGGRIHRSAAPASASTPRAWRSRQRGGSWTKKEHASACRSPIRCAAVRSSSGWSIPVCASISPVISLRTLAAAISRLTIFTAIILANASIGPDSERP